MQIEIAIFNTDILARKLVFFIMSEKNLESNLVFVDEKI